MAESTVEDYVRGVIVRGAGYRPEWILIPSSCRDGKCLQTVLATSSIFDTLYFISETLFVSSIMLINRSLVSPLRICFGIADAN